MEILIKQFREKAEITKTELAKQTGITRQYLAQIESGKSIPTVLILFRISRVLHCTLEDLVKEIQ